MVLHTNGEFCHPALPVGVFSASLGACSRVTWKAFAWAHCPVCAGLAGLINVTELGARAIIYEPTSVAFMGPRGRKGGEQERKDMVEWEVASCGQRGQGPGHCHVTSRPFLNLSELRCLHIQNGESSPMQVRNAQGSALSQPDTDAVLLWRVR